MTVSGSVRKDEDMGCKNHPDAQTIEERPPVARYQCPADTRGKRQPGCMPIVKPAKDAPPAACPVCRQARVRDDLDAVQYYCGEPDCFVQNIP